MFHRARPRSIKSMLTSAAVLAALLVSSSVVVPQAASAAGDLGVHALTTNGRVDPLGIPGTAPTFGWALASEERHVVQSAYEIEVGSEPGAADVWDSGKIESRDQVDISYAGPDLTSATEYSWRVRAWDGDGNVSAWSEPASFETGLLGADDWAGAQWIGRTAAYATWTDYTATVDFTLNNAAFGVFLRAADSSNAYMWQLNVGTSPSSVPVLAPHRRVNGGYTSLANIDLRASGFTRAALLEGTHRLTFDLVGNTIKTSLDGVVIDTRTVTDFAAGGIGVRTWGAESVTVHGVSVNRPDGTVLASPAFDQGNPFTGGNYANSAVTIAGELDAMLKTGESNAPLLRTSFDTQPGKTVASARVYASAHGIYELSLNGEKVGDHEVAPGYTEYDKRIQSQTYDVTDQVVAGVNGFGAAVGDGWWAGKVGLAGKHQYGTDLAVIARLKIVYTDGSVQWVDTDTAWTWATGPYAATDLQIGETYDARYERPGWTTGDYDAAGWTPVREMPSDTPKLSPQPDEPVRQTEVLDTVAVTQPVAGVHVYDLGQNMVGVPRVTISGTAGQTVKLRHAEVLNPDGTLYTENLRAALATDYYTFAADGTVTYEPAFTQHGFRYIEITGLDAAPSASDVKGVVWGSDLARTGTLETSNSMLNQLLSNVSWGARGNFLSIPTDTPARDERLGWTGDISIFGPSASYMFDMRSFLGKWMLDVRDEQKPDGQIPAVVPSTKGAFDGSGPGWQEAVITVPYALYRAYDDLTAVEQSWSNMLKFYDFAAGRIGPDNLGAYASTFFTGDDWLSLENTGGASNEVKSTALWADAVRMLAELATALGDERAQEFTDRYAAIKEDFVAAYVAPDGTIAGGAQTVYALALGMDLIDDPALKAKVGEKFVAKLAQTDNHLTTGFIGTPYLLPAMSAIGRDDLAYDMLLKETYPSWGFSIAQGATTVWERWNSLRADGTFGPVDMNSFNHYAYGAVVDWMHQNIGGIRIGEPGYRTSIIEPRPGGGLTEAKGEIDTVYGTLASSWKLTDGALSLDVTIPPNTTSEVRIPSTSRWTVFEGGESLADVDGVLEVERDSANGLTVVTVGSGSYSFSTTTGHAGTIAVLDRLGDFSSSVAADERLTPAVRETILDAAADATSSVEAALQSAGAGETAAASDSLNGALVTIRELRTWIRAAGIEDAKTRALVAKVDAIVLAIQTELTGLAGIAITVAPQTGPVAVGGVVRGSVVVRNSGDVPITGITGTVASPGLLREPLPVSAGAIAPGAETVISFDIPTSVTARAGTFDLDVSLVLSTAGGQLIHHSALEGWVALATDVAIDSVTTDATGSLLVALTNRGVGPVTGRVEATVPAAWRSTPSPLSTIQPGASTTVRVPVYSPHNAIPGSYRIGVELVDRGAVLATTSTQITVGAPSTPPTEPVADHVDFGNTASETAHSLQASPTSGTSSEAGFTRRYAHNNTPGSWYSARVKVTPGQPFILRMRETWNTAGTKDYDILVDDQVVQRVNLARADGGQGITNHQVLVADEASLDNDGFVTVKFQYPASSAPFQYYDPSIADLWVVMAPATVAPTVSATPDDDAVFDDGAYRSDVTMTVNAADSVDSDPRVEYWSGGQWIRYVEPVTFDEDGVHEFRFRASDRFGNVSAVEVVTIRIDRSTPQTDVAFTAGPATTRCVAGKVVLAVSVTNDETVPIAVDIVSPFGSKTIASVAPGKTVTHAFTTRAGTITAGDVAVTAKVTKDAADIETTKNASYGSRACG